MAPVFPRGKLNEFPRFRGGGKLHRRESPESRNPLSVLAPPAMPADLGEGFGEDHAGHDAVAEK